MAKNRKVTRKKARVNRQDLTLRNLRAIRTRLDGLARRVSKLEKEVISLGRPA